MKNLRECIVNESQEITYYNGDVQGFVTTDEKTFKEYHKHAEEELAKLMGTCPKSADKKGLFDGVEGLYGSERTGYDICAVFDKKHKSAKYGTTLASCIFVGERSDKNDYAKYNEYFDKRFDDKYFCICGCVREIKGKKMFDMYLS